MKFYFPKLSGLTRITKQYQLKNYRFLLLATVLMLSVIGYLVVGSAKEGVQGRQLFGMILGIFLMVFLSLVDYVWILRVYWFIYGGIILLLLVVKFFGVNYNGAKRWLGVEGGFTFQPSEFVKILLILFLAKYIMEHASQLNTPKELIKLVGLGLFPMALIASQPDMSTTISILAVFCLLLFIGGLSYRIIGKIFAVALPLAIIFLGIVVQPGQKLISDYQRDRIMAWLEPEKYSTDEGYQQQNSVMAIGSGQLEGKGLNNNTITSVKNGNFLVEPETDFIFAIVGEELGFIGSCVVIGLLLMVVILCIFTGIKARDLAGRLICCGVASQIGIQSFINIAVATGMIPNTGIPLPFVSYGLSSLVSMFMGVGVVLNIGLQQKKY